MIIRIPSPNDFWLWLCRYSYKQMTTGIVFNKEPAGIPGRRDPDSLCDAYAPRAKNKGEWDGCQTDGHYLCRECALMDEDKLKSPDWKNTGEVQEEG